MHELSIAQQIVDIACGAHPGRRVVRIGVVVGKLSAVLPDSLRFCFDLACEDTPAAGARIEIRETPGRARCRACGAEVELTQPFGRCACGQTDLEWLSGEELLVDEVEVI